MSLDIQFTQNFFYMLTQRVNSYVAAGSDEQAMISQKGLLNILSGIRLIAIGLERIGYYDDAAFYHRVHVTYKNMYTSEVEKAIVSAIVYEQEQKANERTDTGV